MKRYSNIWSRIVAAAIVATGVAVVWALACGWIGSLATTLLNRERINESLQVALDGTPVISVESYASYNSISLSRRKLDGESWPNDYEHWLNAAYLEPRQIPPRLIQPEPQWSAYGERIGGATDGKKPPTAWYIVRSIDSPGSVHWVGYDVMSKLPVGYIGTKGFRVTPPPKDERFGLPQGNLGQLGRYVTSPQYLDFNGFVYFHDLANDQRPASWLAFQIDGERLWQIDLRERSARVALEVPSARSLGLLWTRRDLVETAMNADASPEASAAISRKRAPFRLVAATLQDSFVPTTGTFIPATPLALAEGEEPPRMAGVIAIRSDERIVLYDATSGRERPFRLPKDLPHDGVFVYWTAPDELFLYYRSGYWSGGTINRLLWIDPDGAIKREQQLELQGFVPPGEREQAWQLAPAVPVPIFWAGRVLVRQPILKVQWNQTDTYSAALRNIIHINWPPLVTVLLVSLVTTWPAVRWHRRYARSGGYRWTALVALFGPAGLIAYWLEHRRATFEECGECHATVPRDRDACAACESPFSAPSLVGTEIFA